MNSGKHWEGRDTKLERKDDIKKIKNRVERLKKKYNKEKLQFGIERIDEVEQENKVKKQIK